MPDGPIDSAQIEPAQKTIIVIRNRSRHSHFQARHLSFDVDQFNVVRIPRI